MKVKKLLVVIFMALIICFAILSKTIYQLSRFGHNGGGDGCSDSGLTAINTSNAEAESYDNFRVGYFANLTKNFGQNLKGSCGYVALAMLLSYYDTYWDDNIVPEQYDVVSTSESNNFVDEHNSPGTMHETVNANEYDYYYEMKLLIDQSLQSKLIKIGFDLNYIDVWYENYKTNCTQRKTILDCYLQDFMGYSENEDYEISYLAYEYSYTQNSPKIKEYIISHIKAGEPVLIGITDDSFINHHACIAYDYDEDLDKIYCHMGLPDKGTHVAFEDTDYKYFKSAMVIDFKGEHSHSYNYVSGDKAYCPCMEDACIYSHAEKSVSMNSSYHNTACACGKVNKDTAHTLNIYEQYSLEKHYLCCEGCDLKELKPHKFLPYKLGATTQYRCICGQYKIDHIIAPIGSVPVEEYFM